MNLNAHIIVALASCVFLTGIRENNVATELNPLSKRYSYNKGRKGRKNRNQASSIKCRRRNK
jgi:hypothetical protein